MCADRLLYENYLDAQLARWTADLDRLKVRARNMEVDARDQYDRSIEALQREHDETSHHLSSLRGASDEAWKSVQAGRNWMKFKSVFLDAALAPKPLPSLQKISLN